MSQADEAFLAGSPSFSQALLAPLTEGTGRRPRVVADPAQAMLLCAGSPGLLVVEAAPEWLPAIERLRRLAPGLRVVAAVAPGQEEAGARLGALGVEAVAWAGQPGPVVQAVARLAAARTRPAAPAEAPPILARGVQPPPDADQAWPGGAPSEEAAESALVRSLRGKLAPDAPLAGPAALTLAALSRLERQALAGEPLPFDASPIYRSAVTRLRVSVALSTVPAPPAPVDQDAVQRLLADLDEVLGQVNPLSTQAPEAHQAGLEAVRNALVRVAVDFSEAAHRLGTAGVASQAPAAQPVRARPQAAARVLSVHAGGEAADAPPRRPGALLVALAVVTLLVGGFHAWRWATTPPPEPPATLPGAPANTLTFENESGRFLMAFGGAPVAPAELQHFVEQEKAKGFAVREIAPGTWIIEPDKAPRGGGKP